MDIEEKERIDRKLYSSLFKTQAEQIPIEILEEDEKPIVLKCVNQEEASADEIKNLRKILVKYREVVEEFNVKEIEENIERTENQIRNERDFLKLCQTSEEDRKLKMRRWHKGKEYILHFRVKPLNDSQAIIEMQNHLELFKDCSTEERLLLDKANRGEPLSPEEAKMLEYLNAKIEEKMYTKENIIRAWEEFLARQVEFEDSELTTIDEKLEFWKTVDINMKSSLYNKVRQMLYLDETRTDDLFLDD